MHVFLLNGILERQSVVYATKMSPQTNLQHRRVDGNFLVHEVKVKVVFERRAFDVSVSIVLFVFIPARMNTRMFLNMGCRKWWMYS